MRSAVNFCIYCQRVVVVVVAVVFTLHRYVLIQRNFHFDFETCTCAHMMKWKRNQRADNEASKQASQKAMNLTAIQSSQMIHCLFVHVCRAISLKPTKAIERTNVRTTIRLFVFVHLFGLAIICSLLHSFVQPTNRESENENEMVGLKCKCMTIVCICRIYPNKQWKIWGFHTHSHTHTRQQQHFSE